eukprot:comp23054_c0_seq1/m.36915 comp23054_c0_seq1/g.36915  ORF comp23054_c0_seq1/g.36915 comp23054_c0_seq1/m.36915 type:complete len:762 (-) comp23054_c0_seq1:532-2817(-)
MSVTWRQRLEVIAARPPWMVGMLSVVVLLPNALRVMSGHNTCEALLHTGEWGPKDWLPTGCMAFSYAGTPHGATCLAGREALFVGDARAREAFEGVAAALGANITMTGNDAMAVVGREATAVKLQYLYRPTLRGEVDTTWLTQRPYIAVYAHGLEEAAAGLPDQKYLEKVQEVGSGMEGLGSLAIKVLWLGPGVVGQSTKVTQHAVDSYEAVARGVDQASKHIDYLASASLLARDRPDMIADDGLHLAAPAKAALGNLVLNYACNNVTAPKLHPPQISCCVPSPQRSHLQTLTLAFYALCLIAYVVMGRTHHAAPPSDKEAQGGEAASANITQQYLVALAQLGLVMGLTYVMDRTDLFLKEKKRYSHVAFFVPALIAVLVGLGSLHKVGQPGFLNRDQSDEWKGWMQIMFLIYHYVGASGVLPIYVLIRIFVGAYIWLSGYGHFFFFYKKGDFGFPRVLQVLYRINFLAFWLCLTMGKPYHFYYFCPLISFWFLAVYSLMGVLHHYNGETYVVPAKILFLCLFGAVFWMPGADGTYPLFDFVFGPPSPLYPLVQENGSIVEWRFRSGLDRYAIPSGMLLGMLYTKLEAMGQVRDKEAGSLFSNERLNMLVGLCSAFVLLGYVAFATTCTDKVACNQYHTNVSPLIITAFVLLRNCFGPARAVFSKAFAFAGKISLELFLLQCHAWMGSDTKGIIMAFPGWPLLNACVMTLLFVYMSMWLHHLTGVLADLCLPRKATVMQLAQRAGGFALVTIVLYMLPTGY